MNKLAIFIPNDKVDYPLQPFSGVSKEYRGAHLCIHVFERDIHLASYEYFKVQNFFIVVCVLWFGCNILLKTLNPIQKYIRLNRHINILQQ